MTAFKYMIPWLFAGDKVHYTGYESAYWLEMSSLETTSSHGYSASFSCLRLFPHLLVKIPNSFLCMC